MVSSIEDQLLQALVDEEELRCLAQEAEFDKDPATKGKKVKRRNFTKPWTRPTQEALCLDSELLAMVFAFDFNLSDPSFLNYCTRRGAIHSAGAPDSPRREFMADHSKTKSDFMGDPVFQFAQEANGHQHQFTPEEMEHHWLTVQIGRGRLQDCWELYQRDRAIADDI